MAYFFDGQPGLAVEWARKGVRHRQAPQTWTVTTLIMILGHLGLRDEAKKTCEELLRVQPNVTCKFVRANLPLYDREKLDLYMEGLCKAGLSE